ncbi:hypothetical protein Csa_005666 [Cucumis sativus]|uniref:Uncharacterized protein n=1 Tax=Cucumis sativus TaxID=3659 RepID=A0A0A0K8B1_CUCSA|nr:hypothetical protein Csa_005666 [Cucumis sativus]
MKKESIKLKRQSTKTKRALIGRKSRERKRALFFNNKRFARSLFLPVISFFFFAYSSILPSLSNSNFIKGVGSAQTVLFALAGIIVELISSFNARLPRPLDQVSWISFRYAALAALF